MSQERQTPDVAAQGSFEGPLGVFAPSGPFDPDRFDRGLERLEARGIDIYVPDSIRAREGYLAGDDTHRARGLLNALNHPEIDTWIAARGGYGMQRILPETAEALAEPHGKTFIGFSDVTALHQVLQQSGHSSLHGPVITQLGALPDEDIDHLIAALNGTPSDLSDLSVIHAGHERRAEGPLVGGNLALLQSLVGTPYLHVPQGAVLLLEDVGERPYRIDRMLTHLLLAGIFDKVSGVVLGDFYECGPPGGIGPTARDVIDERLKDLGIPVLADLPVGHGHRNLSLVLGRTVVLDSDTRSLSYV